MYEENTTGSWNKKSKRQEKVVGVVRNTGFLKGGKFFRI
jgi:hypothetical protein